MDVDYNITNGASICQMFFYIDIFRLLLTIKRDDDLDHVFLYLMFLYLNFSVFYRLLGNISMSHTNLSQQFINYN